MSPPSVTGTAAEKQPVPCRYCGAPETTVIDRRGGRVLRHCSSCKLSWTADAEPDREPRG